MANSILVIPSGKLINIVWYLAIKILADLVCCAEWTSSYRIFPVDMPEASKSSFPHCSLTQCFIMLWLPHAWFWNVIVTLLSHFLFYSAFMHKALPLNTISGGSLVVPPTDMVNWTLDRRLSSSDCPVVYQNLSTSSLSSRSMMTGSW